MQIFVAILRLCQNYTPEDDLHCSCSDLDNVFF